MRRLGILAAVVSAVAAAPAALADATDDYNAVQTDYAAHGKRVTHCRFTAAALKNAKSVAQSVGEGAYGGGDPAFVPAVDAELGYQGAGNCGNSTVPTGTPAKGTKLGLAVSPKSATVGVKTTFTFTVTGFAKGKRVAVKGVQVSFAGTKRKTDKHGRAKLTKSFSSAGKRKAKATRRGYRSGKITVRILP
jgi:hypothetical protein